MKVAPETRIISTIMIDGLRDTWSGYDTSQYKLEYETTGEVSLPDHSELSPNLPDFVSMCGRALQLGFTVRAQRHRSKQV